jgi:hypothetical protein
MLMTYSVSPEYIYIRVHLQSYETVYELTSLRAYEAFGAVTRSGII